MRGGAANATRMKKRSVSGSPYCALSAMLQSCEVMQLATAATIPRRSPQESVNTKRAGSAGIKIPEGIAKGGDTYAKRPPAGNRARAVRWKIAIAMVTARPTLHEARTAGVAGRMKN